MLLILKCAETRQKFGKPRSVVEPRGLYYRMAQSRLVACCVMTISLDLQAIEALLTDCFNEALCKLNIGDQRYSEVNGAPPDQVVIGQFLLLERLRNINDQVDL